MTTQSSCGKCPGGIPKNVWLFSVYTFFFCQILSIKFQLLLRNRHVAVADLSAVIVEDAHQADGHHLVDAAAQSFPGERKHKRHLLFATSVDDGVERFVQASCTKTTAHHESQGQSLQCSVADHRTKCQV